MTHPEQSDAEGWDQLYAERERYPYCAPLQMLSLLADKRSHVPLWQKQSLPRVRLYVKDPAKLQAMLNTEDCCRPAPPVVPIPVAVAASVAPPVLPDDFDVLQEINSYQEVSFKTAPKSVILSSFLDDEADPQADTQTYWGTPVPELAKKSVSQDAHLGTETLALVLERQGNFTQAIAMYEKLMADNPEKSSIFAARIAQLRLRLNDE